MEFWLKIERDDGMALNANQVFQLPVNPPAIEKSINANNETFETESLGEVSFIGKKKLATIPISSFFPAQNYNFCQCTPKDDPYEYTRIIEDWMFWSQPVRLIVTETNINMLCSIESFSYKEQFGTKDIDFTLNLREYRKLPS